MEKVTPIEVYVFHKIDRPGLFLHLYKGVIPNVTGPYKFRWMFRGLRCPFPVHNGVWFEGFEPEVMKHYVIEKGFKFIDKVNLTEINN